MTEEKKESGSRSDVGWVSVNDRLPPIGTDCECRGVFDNIWRVTHWRVRSEPGSRSERDETLRYLRGQHAAVMKRIEHYTTDGNGAPGFVEQLQRDARGIEASMQAILCTPVSELGKRHWVYAAAEKHRRVVEGLVGTDRERAHLIYMLDSIGTGKMSATKSCRWLGWIQGVLNEKGALTLDEAKAINKEAKAINKAASEQHERSGS